MSGIIFFIVFAIVILNFLSHFAKQGKNEESRKSGQNNGGKAKQFSSSPFLMIQKTKLNGAWMESAGEMGLSFLRPNENNPLPAIGGNIENMQISVSLREEPGSGIMETHYKVLYPEDLGLDFYFVKAVPERMKIFSKGKKRWDKLDRELPEYSSKEEIFLTAKDEKILESFLDKKRKEDLFWCLQFQEELLIDDRSVTLIYDGIDDKVEEITARIRLVLQLARTFGSLSNGEKILYHRLPVKNVSEKVSAMPEEKKSTLPPSPSPVTGTVLPPLPKVVFPKPEMNKKEEVREEKFLVPPVENTGKVEDTEKTECMQTPVPEAVESVSSVLSINDIAEHLFSNSFAGSGEKEYFNTVKGDIVSWNGVLQSAYDYSSDFLFGSGGGVKAKFLLMEYKKEGSFLISKIFAVVSFPKSEGEFLRKNIGRKFAFSGKIFHFESISKEIMLSDGSFEKQ